MDKRIFMTVLASTKKPPVEFEDDFTRSDGAIANDWTGATWTVATGKAVNTPNIDATEKLTDGGVENWADATHLTSWEEYSDGGNTLDQEGTDKVEGSYSAKLTWANGGANNWIRQSVTTAKRFFHVVYKEKVPLTKQSKFTVDASGSDDPNMSFVGTGDWATRIRTARTTAANTFLRFNKQTTNPANGSAFYFDDSSAKLLVDAELFATRPVYATADYLLEVSIASMEIGTMAGIVLGLNSPTSPTDYVLVYHNGQTLWVKKVVSSGDFVTVGSKVQAFSANDKITVAKLGTSVKVYLNDVAIAATYTVDDASIKDNLYAGIFSSYSGNTFDDWSEKVKVVGGSSAFLAPFL